MADDADADVLTILVATDSHLGYMERDPVRGLDSFAAFEEALILAKKNKADLVLLGGDLFHDNKPSRRTLHRTMDILRRHCMGPEAVRFQVVSDQSENFKGPYNTVNFEDAFFSVGLPVFSIHGNHDDPTRDSGGMDSLAALDLLQVANLVNYFGKSEKVDNVEVSPVLIRKGATKLAMYGLGSMRDERLNRMWNSKKVKFMRPEDAAGRASAFFNLLVLHQNRDAGRGKKNCVHESMIPEWMDLVVWGHEHECRISEGPEESMVGTFRIAQPGSSVATSLVEGEAKRKMVGLLKIRQDKFLFTGIPLTQVRAFRTEDLSLADVEALDPDNNANLEAAVAQILVSRVQSIVADLREQVEAAEAEPLPTQAYKLVQKERVLVRLRVEHTGFPTINTQRFGSGFMDDVANPTDILLFHRKRVTAQGDAKTEGGAASKGARKGADKGGGLAAPLRPEALDSDDICVEDLVLENLRDLSSGMGLLLEEPMNNALESYVKKSEAGAIDELVKATVESELKALKDSEAATEAEVRDAVAKAAPTRRAVPVKTKRVSKAKAAAAAKASKGGDEEAGAAAAAAAGASSHDEQANNNNDNEDDDLEDSEEEQPVAKGRGGKKSAAAAAPKATAAAKKRGAAGAAGSSTTGQKRGRGTLDAYLQKGGSSAAAAADSDESDVQEMAPPKPRAAARGGRGGRAGGAGSSRATAAASAASKRRSKKAADDEEDDDEVMVVDSDEDDILDDETPAPPRAGKGKQKAAAATTRRAAKPPVKARKRYVADSDEDDVNGHEDGSSAAGNDDEEEELEFMDNGGGASKKGRKAPAKRAAAATSAAADGNGAARKRRRAQAEQEETPRDSTAVQDNDVEELLSSWGVN